MYILRWSLIIIVFVAYLKAWNQSESTDSDRFHAFIVVQNKAISSATYNVAIVTPTTVSIQTILPINRLALGDTASFTAWALYKRQQANFCTCYVVARAYSL